MSLSLVPAPGENGGSEISIHKSDLWDSNLGKQW